MAIQLEEDGYLTFVRKGQEVSLDIYEANNAYAALAAQSGTGAELGRAWRDWLAERGLGAISEGLAYQVISEVQKALIEFKKKRGWETPSPSPDSNGSTASPSAE